MKKQVEELLKKYKGLVDYESECNANHAGHYDKLLCYQSIVVDLSYILSKK